MARQNPGAAICVYNFSTNCYGSETMGKGDQRTRRGKLFRGSYGKTRPGRIKKKKNAPKK